MAEGCAQSQRQTPKVFDSSSGTLKLSKIEAVLSCFAPLKVVGKESSVHPNQSLGNDHKQPCIVQPQQTCTLIEDDLHFAALYCFQVLPACFLMIEIMFMSLRRVMFGLQSEMEIHSFEQ